MRIILKDDRENDSLREVFIYQTKNEGVGLGIEFDSHVPYPVDFNNKYYCVRITLLFWTVSLVLRW